MGHTFEFQCPVCGYSATVSGGDDYGMGSATTTVRCDHCKTIRDVVTSEEPWDASSIKKVTDLKCPKCSGPVTKWRGKRCPKCGGKMEIIGEGILWD